MSGLWVTPIAFDEAGEPMWSLPETESSLGVVVGDGLVVSIESRSEIPGESDGGVLLTGYAA